MSIMVREACLICDKPAVVELFNSENGRDELYCHDHDPKDSANRLPSGYSIRRFRLEPGNLLSQAFAAPSDSPEHLSLRTDMCEAQLLGSEGACRYYLSALTGVDQFVAWNDAFFAALQSYLEQDFGENVSRFCTRLDATHFLEHILRDCWERSHNLANSKRPTKELQAIKLLLRHPSWSEEQIAQAAGTTTAQLRRWPDFQLARRTWRLSSPGE